MFFKYKALTPEKKIANGFVEASSQEAVAEILEEKGFSIIYIEEVGSGKAAGGGFVFGLIRTKDLVTFFRQFSVMISANVPLLESLKVLIGQTLNPKLKIVVSEMADEIDNGARLSEAFSRRPNVFSGFHVNVVKSGETSGRLDEVLNYLADEMEKDYDMMSKIRGALIYPAFIFCGLGVVGALMMIYVVPQLTAILTESGASLPLSTRILIGSSAFLKANWVILLVALLGLLVGVRFYIRTAKGRRIFDLIKLHLPIFGNLFRKIYIVRFTRSMHTLLLGGVTITNSLKIAGEVVDNEIFKELIERTAKEAEDGNSISVALMESKEVPKMVPQMISIGEKTGKLDIILSRISDFYSREITNLIANLMTLMEPIIMIVLGVAVGIMIAAIILPMYSVASQTG